MKGSILALCLMIFSTVAMAEGGCPPGTYPANPPATNVCYPFPDQGNNQSSQQPQVRWENRWGAITIGNGSKFGVTAGMRSKSKAIKAAVAQCRANGGGDGCKKAPFSYNNACAALAWGDTNFVMQSHSTIETASNAAMQECSTMTNNCKIYYADCSLPVRMQ
jgi:Domain of unknown function (DUF4189)